MKNFEAKAKKRLGKKRMEIVAFVEVDNGTDVVYEVGLKDGYVSMSYGTTIWGFNREHLDSGDYTEKTMLDDLMYWYSTVEYQEKGPHRFAS